MYTTQSTSTFNGNDKSRHTTLCNNMNYIRNDVQCLTHTILTVQPGNIVFDLIHFQTRRNGSYC